MKGERFFYGSYERIAYSYYERNFTQLEFARRLIASGVSDDFVVLKRDILKMSGGLVTGYRDGSKSFSGSMLSGEIGDYYERNYEDACALVAKFFASKELSIISDRSRADLIANIMRIIDNDEYIADENKAYFNDNSNLENFSKFMAETFVHAITKDINRKKRKDKFLLEQPANMISSPNSTGEIAASQKMSSSKNAPKFKDVAQEPNIKCDTDSASQDQIDFALFDSKLGAVELREKAYYHRKRGDNLTAAKYFELSSEKGDSHATLVLAHAYRDGKGVKWDYDKALPLYHKVLDMNDSHYFVKWAQYSLGIIHLNGNTDLFDVALGIEWLKKSAGNNCVGAQRIIGGFYEEGANGFPVDYKEAARWYIKAANSDDEKGSPTDIGLSQYRLGLMYREGRGVRRDNKKANEWLEQAAKNGNKDAKIEVEIMRDL